MEKSLVFSVLNFLTFFTPPLVFSVILALKNEYSNKKILFLFCADFIQIILTGLAFIFTAILTASYGGPIKWEMVFIRLAIPFSSLVLLTFIKTKLFLKFFDTKINKIFFWFLATDVFAVIFIHFLWFFVKHNIK